MTTADEYRIDIWIAAPPELVFDYFTVPERLVEWQGTAAQLEPRPGGRYRVEYGEAAVLSGEFLEVDPPRRLVYRRCLEGHDAGSSRVEVELVPERDGTRVYVLHTGFAPDEGIERGWSYFLDQLRKRLA